MLRSLDRLAHVSRMVRQTLLSIAIALAGFTAGLALTGRLPLHSRPAASPVPAEPDAPRPGVAAPASGEAPAPPVAAAPMAQVSLPPGGAPDFTRVAADAVKGVVNISSLQVVRTPNSPFANDPFFRYFFGSDDSFGSRDRRSLSLGSGVVISPDGYIVTNNHVVGENEQRITITLGDKREIEGVLIGTDPATDIALIKIEERGLPVVAWGDSSALKIGEWVLAIGSPFQLSQTVTAGIVSAVGRSNVGFADYEDFIQTDAAINPGNSGGALVDGRGELVGINTGIFSQSGGYQGIGFAVPSNLARRVVQDLKQYRRSAPRHDRRHRVDPGADAAVGRRARRPEYQRRPRRADVAQLRRLHRRPAPRRRHRRLQRQRGDRPVAVLPARGRRDDRIDGHAARAAGGPRNRRPRAGHFKQFERPPPPLTPTTPRTP